MKEEESVPTNDKFRFSIPILVNWYQLLMYFDLDSLLSLSKYLQMFVNKHDAFMTSKNNRVQFNVIIPEICNCMSLIGTD